MSDSKNRQIIPGTISVMATPIGNMGDLSDRARKTLVLADHIFCEDTRVAKRLIAAGDIRSQAKFHRVDQHASREDIDKLLSQLTGCQIVVLSDAGTPGVNDPGATVVSVGRGLGFVVTAIPGPCAYITLFSVSGWDASEVLFRGFFPRKPGEIQKVLGALLKGSDRLATFWFESPKRMEKTLKLISSFEGLGGRWIVGKELTKKFEWICEGSIEVVRQKFVELDKSERGEWCFGFKNVASRPDQSRQNDGNFLNDNYVNLSQQNWDRALRCLIDSGISVSNASKTVSQYFGIPKNEAYSLGLKIKSKKI